MFEKSFSRAKFQIMQSRSVDFELKIVLGLHCASCNFLVGCILNVKFPPDTHRYILTVEGWRFDLEAELLQHTGDALYNH